jgi:3-hydroxyisobutyrate dehydrogenase-like beta-hydroxyacid dehydrogenase
MGAWFARFFKSRGSIVTVSDRSHIKAKRLASRIGAKYAPNNSEAARRSDCA